MERRRVIFRADATPHMGGGHVMRCLALAERMRSLGWSIGFACVSKTLSTVPRLRDLAEILDFPDSQQLDARALAARWPSGCDILVVDHYELDAAFETTCRGWAASIVVIDDLACRPHDCDILIDMTLGRSTKDYETLTSRDTMVLAGSDYALLRPEFAAAREASIARRQRRGGVARVLVTLGLTDLGGMTERVVSALLKGLPTQILLDMVVGAAAASRATLEKLAACEPRVRLHVAPPNMAALMASADLAIGAGGTSSWERCCVGLPTVLLVLADNQLLVARRLEDAGAAIVAPLPLDTGFAAIVVGLANDSRRLQNMTAAAAGLTDGRGVERVALAIGRLQAMNP